MSAVKENKKVDRPPDLRTFLRELVRAGRISQEMFEDVSGKRRSSHQQQEHLLIYLSSLEMEDQKYPGKILTTEELTRFLVQWSGQEYYHIDPLSIDASKVAQQMSYAFTQRHKIMAVGAWCAILSGQGYVDWCRCPTPGQNFMYTLQAISNAE